MAKLDDKDEITCGPESPMPLRNKQVRSFVFKNRSILRNICQSHLFQIISLDQNILCPPEENGKATELLLQLLCCLLSILIILVLAKLGYDYSIYRRRGQLPWLALKMP